MVGEEEYENRPTPSPFVDEYEVSDSPTESPFTRVMTTIPSKSPTMVINYTSDANSTVTSNGPELAYLGFLALTPVVFGSAYYYVFVLTYT
jgi:hypothetical protein